MARSPARQSVAQHSRCATTPEGNATSFLARHEVDRCFDLGRFQGAAPGTDPVCLTVLLDLLAEDARFTMPPLPAWFDGREDVGRFLAQRVFATPWWLVPIAANRQTAFTCY